MTAEEWRQALEPWRAVRGVTFWPFGVMSTTLIVSNTNKDRSDRLRDLHVFGRV